MGLRANRGRGVPLMLKSLGLSTALFAAPVAAFAGGSGGADGSQAAWLVEAATRLIVKLLGLF